MSQFTAAYKTYTAIGNREDLTDVIHDITPEDTPVVSMARRVTAIATFHEWQTDVLPDATTAGKLEGDLLSRATTAPTTRVGNYCQIQSRDATVSGTQRRVRSAGRRDEMAYQVLRMGKTLRLDFEKTVTGNSGWSAGSDGTNTPRLLRSLNSFLTSNTSRGTNGADATQASSAATDETVTTEFRAFSSTTGEPLAKTVLKSMFTNGGKPDVLVVGPFNKQQVSTWVGRTSARQNVDATAIQASADLYLSDYGRIKVLPDIYSRETDAWFLTPEYLKIAYLRPIHSWEAAKVGDADTEVVQAEYTLEVCNEKAHGLVADLTSA